MTSDRQRRRSPRVTISQIAEEAGVSMPTVSRVLNGRTGVSDETRAAVQALLDEHGYQRRGTAQRQRVGLIDFVLRDLDPIWAMPLIQGAETEAMRAGASIVLTSTHGRSVGNRRWIQHLASRRTDAVVIVVSELSEGAAAELGRLHTPVVLVDPVGSAPGNMPTVAAANRAGGRMATEHLFRLGHRRIGIVTGPQGVRCSEDRLEGYRDAHRRHGIPLDPHLQDYGDFMPASGLASARRMLGMSRRPTAIFAGTDQTASGVYTAARERHLRIPEDLSVVGFDDVILSEWLQPPLTTVRQPLEQMARAAIRAAAQIAYEGRAPSGRLELPTSLTLRASTSAPMRAAA
ncbi:LacI family DNA-binding transcriptional regulator [Demequina muriae]|uniref:LacI family DNA-binding transcriptional regulator n=1 Tax=Demequina muriae TaxID=3051664 RepID=A0ABT8GIF9_9MICO|nr:LacI family DNA-binding transcriptional regulator [Demequina sp. EGI L300058]MDN4481214.1 LacI family DNA-binding transcriptional regulator [Demequina sp. EGI L300058]